MKLQALFIINKIFEVILLYKKVFFLIYFLIIYITIHI